MNAMRLNKNEEDFILLVAKHYKSGDYIIDQVEAREQLKVSPAEMDAVLRALHGRGVYKTMSSNRLLPRIEACQGALDMAREIEATRAEAAHPDRVAQFWGWAHRNLLVAALIIIAGAAFCILGLVKLILGLIAFFRT